MFRLIFTLVLIAHVKCCTFECQRNGNFRNPNDKHSYIQCYDGNAYLKRCQRAGDGLGYMVFKGQQCMEPFDCHSIDGKYRHGMNDSLYYECIQGVPYLRHCTYGRMFDGIGSCIEGFVCPTLGGMYTNQRNGSQYFECCYGKWDLKTCPFGYKFKESAKSCVKNHDFLCPTPNGRFKDVRNDTQYFWCIGGVVHVIACPLNFVFDGINECYEPFRCPLDSGKFANPKNQSEYYLCWYNTPLLKSCPYGSVFDVRLKDCTEVYICPNPNGYFRVPGNEGQYYWCRNNVGYIQHCPAGQVFDGHSGCRKYTQCPTPHKLTPNPRNQSQYYECTESGYQLHSCPCDHIFDEREQRCVSNNIYECNQNQCVHHCPPRQRCPSRPCTRQLVYDGHRCVRPYRCSHGDGNYKDYRNNKHYYECKGGKVSLHRCSHDYVYDDKDQCCVHSHSIRRESVHNGMRIKDVWDESQQRWVRTYIRGADSRRVVPYDQGRSYDSYQPYSPNTYETVYRPNNQVMPMYNPGQSSVQLEPESVLAPVPDDDENGDDEEDEESYEK